MPQNLTHYRCLLISPGDVQKEREALRKAVELWNAQIGESLKVRVELVGWDSHARPEMGGPPQEVLNRQIVDACDFGVAVFWYRLGSPTKEHPSGSAEEIERLLAKGANVMVYFSSCPVPQDGLHDDQYKRLQELKTQYQERGLYVTYPSVVDLTQKFTLHLTSLVSGLLVKDRASDQPIPSTGTITSPRPDIRIKVSAALAYQYRAAALLAIEIQNHSPNDFFFAGIKFPLSNDTALFVQVDAITQQPIVPQKIAPGDTVTFYFQPDRWDLKGETVRTAVIRDKIDRTWSADDIEFAEAFASHYKNLRVIAKSGR